MKRDSANPQLVAQREVAANSQIWSWSERRWKIRAIAFLVGAIALAGGAGAALAYYGTDAYLLVGYAPQQPVEFNHQQHARDLGLDCRFCHTSVDRGPMAGLPSSQLCMNCHQQILPESVKLLPLRATFAENRPLAWVRVTQLPGFTYFDHSAHFTAGIGCSSCHGRVDLMARTEQAFSLSMGFCLDCHREPGPYLREPADLMNMAFQPRSRPASALPSVSADRTLSPPLHCSGCHR